MERGTDGREMLIVMVMVMAVVVVVVYLLDV